MKPHLQARNRNLKLQENRYDNQFNAEQEVLLWVIRVDHTKDPLVAELLAAGVDWDYVRETAVKHGIIPLLYQRLKGEMAYIVPPDELVTIRTLFIANAMRNIRMTQHLFEVLDLLAGEGVDAMPFKGPVLAVQAYGDLSMRSFCDLDILIHTNDISRVSRILTDLGYVQINLVQTRVERILSLFLQKDLQFSFQDEILEFHWKIIERLYAVPLDMEQVWDRSLPFLLNGRKITTLSPEDIVILLCFHGIKHRWQNLSYLSDLIYTISNNPDLKWHDVFIRAENMGLKRIVLLGLFLAHSHGGIRCGSEIENLFISDTSMLTLAGKIQINLFQFQTSNPVEPLLFLMSRERFKDQIMFFFYYFLFLAQEAPKFLRWVLRQLMG